MTYNEIQEAVDMASIPKALLDKEWVAVARGGLAIALMLATKYDKHLGFVDPTNGTAMFDSSNQNILLIDDVINSGKTLKACKSTIWRKNPKALISIFTFLIDRTNPIQPNYSFIESTELSFPWQA